MRLQLAVTLAALIATCSWASEKPSGGLDVSPIQRAVLLAHARWTAGVTSITELPLAERQKRMGLLWSTSSQQLEAPPLSKIQVPAMLDWRSVNGTNYVTPIRDQGGCGSCWAFSTTAALESKSLIASDTSDGAALDLSEQVLLACSGAGTCAGGYLDGASGFIRDTGLPSEACYPYLGSNGNCTSRCGDWAHEAKRIHQWYWQSHTAADLEKALTRYGPIVATMSVYADFDAYVDGVYRHVSGEFEGYHAVVVIGFDHDARSFIAKNSWGTGWGEGGYFRIDYSEVDSSTVRFASEAVAYETGPTLSIRPRGAVALEAPAPNQMQQKTVTIMNLGDGDLSPSAAVSSDQPGSLSIATDGCTGKVLASQQACTVEVVFSGLVAPSRDVQGVLVIKSNDPNRASVIVPLTGRVLNGWFISLLDGVLD